MGGFILGKLISKTIISDISCFIAVDYNEWKILTNDSMSLVESSNQYKSYFVIRFLKALILSFPEVLELRKSYFYGRLKARSSSFVVGIAKNHDEMV